MKKTKLKQQSGFSLVELLVATAISLAGIVVMMQVFSMMESQRRTTTDGSDAQVNGVIGAFVIERDLRQAGFGVPNTGCTTMRAYDEGRSPAQFTFSTFPVRILRNTPTGSTNDRVEILYSGADIGAVPATIQADMPTSSSILRIDSGYGFKEGQLIAISQGNKDCTLLQLTQDAQPTGTANVTGSGTMWNLQHNPAAPYNPPNGTNTSPPGGYDIGAQVFNFDAFVSRAYYVQNNRLMMEDLRQDVGVSNPVEIVSGVIGMRAFYGRDTNEDGEIDTWDATMPTTGKEVLAVRFALAIRSGNYEKEIVTNASSLELWDGGPSIDLRGESEPDLSNRDKHFRYKIYQTIVPLRNVIWGNAS